MVQKENVVVRALRKMIEPPNTQRAVAAALGISEQLLSSILRGEREVSGVLAGKLGWRKKTVWERIPSHAKQSKKPNGAVHPRTA